jgi:hypothetical protein
MQEKIDSLDAENKSLRMLLERLREEKARSDTLVEQQQAALHDSETKISKLTIQLEAQATQIKQLESKREEAADSVKVYAETLDFQEGLNKQFQSRDLEYQTNIRNITRQLGMQSQQ